MPKHIAVMPVKKIEKLQPPRGRHTKVSAYLAAELAAEPGGRFASMQPPGAPRLATKDGKPTA